MRQPQYKDIRVALVRNLPTEQSISMERYADELSAGLTGAGLAPFSAVPDEIRLAEVLTRKDRLYRYYERYVKYGNHVSKLNADIYHVTDQAYAFVMRSIPPGRAVLTCHDLVLSTSKSWSGKELLAPSRFLFEIGMRELPRAAHIIAVSSATKDDLVEIKGVKPDRISVIPSGLAVTFSQPMTNYSELQSEFRARLNLKPGDWAILHVGHTGPRKNFATVIECVAELQRRGHHAKLVKVGKPLSAEWTLRIASTLAEGTFIPAGLVSDEELRGIYAASDVLLFPSLKEGFGWPVVEAMSCRLPVVTSDDAALVELSKYAGLFAPALDVRGLCACIETVMIDSDLRAAKVARGLVKSGEFSRESTTTAIMQVYDQVLDALPKLNRRGANE